MKTIFKIKRSLLFVCFAITVLLCACGGKHHDDTQFAGTFKDEFDNKFELNSDYTGTVQFAGNQNKENITWSDGDDHKRPYATITYNGDPTYFFLRDGYLYRHEEDMEHGRLGRKITYDE